MRGRRLDLSRAGEMQHRIHELMADHDVTLANIDKMPLLNKSIQRVVGIDTKFENAPFNISAICKLKSANAILMRKIQSIACNESNKILDR